jgi:fructose-specific phosphotransferase system IIC component
MTKALVLLAPEGAMRVANGAPMPVMPAAAAAAAAAAASSAELGFCSDMPPHYLLLCWRYHHSCVNFCWVVGFCLTVDHYQMLRHRRQQLHLQ